MIKGFFKIIWWGFIGIVGLVIIITFIGSIDSEKEGDAPVALQGTPEDCKDAQNTKVDYAISGSGINVRKGPGSKFEKIINKKATKALKRTHYIQVDHTTTIHEHCRKDGWSYIQVIEPREFQQSHRGWIASRFLRAIEKDSAGFRTFKEEDFLWDKNTFPYKSIIIAGVNKIHRENRHCKIIDPSSAYLSASKSTPGKPVFFVTCGDGAKVFNVWFSEDDLKSEKVLKAASHISKGAAISLCEQYARNVATHPSTVDFSRVMDLAINEHPNGRTAVHSTFTAKNSFNLEIKFRIRCLLDATGLIEAAVNEAR